MEQFNEIRDYYRKISEMTSGKQKEYFKYITENAIIGKVKRIEGNLRWKLHRMVEHECYRNAFKFLSYTMGQHEGIKLKYCEGQIWIKGSIPIDHAFIQMDDGKETWFIDPTLEFFERISDEDVYVAFKTFEFMDFVKLLTESEFHGEIFNRWFKSYLE